MPAVSLDDLLAGTSRTFAAAIPLLDGELREEVTLAYLLFRIADTFEDAAAWDTERRADALSVFAQMLRGGRGGALSAPPGFDDAHAALFAGAGDIFARLGQLPAPHAESIRGHVQRTAEGMREFLLAADGGRVELTTLEELERYCYVVAGIVGEMLTDLFVFACPALRPRRALLDHDAAAFGEALQLVNILKDRDDDAGEGRRFLPRGVALDAVFARARRDCDRATDYVDALAAGGASPGIVAFTRFPLRVARETLDALEARGAGAKIGRERVLAILEEERAAKAR